MASQPSACRRRKSASMRCACVMAYRSFSAQMSTDEYRGSASEKKHVCESGKYASGSRSAPGGGAVIFSALVDRGAARRGGRADPEQNSTKPASSSASKVASASHSFSTCASSAQTPPS